VPALHPLPADLGLSIAALGLNSFHYHNGEPGVVFSLERVLHVPGIGTFRHYNTMIVTETDCSVDSRLPRGITRVQTGKGRMARDCPVQRTRAITSGPVCRKSKHCSRLICCRRTASQFTRNANYPLDKLHVTRHHLVFLEEQRVLHEGTNDRV
jgi:hypothetical protein